MAMSTEPQTSAVPSPEELGFDPAELRSRYAKERTRRLREDANAQYQQMKGVFAQYDDDPYVEPGFTRDAVEEELDVPDHRRGVRRSVRRGAGARTGNHQLPHPRKGG